MDSIPGKAGVLSHAVSAYSQFHCTVPVAKLPSLPFYRYRGCAWLYAFASQFAGPC